ncbi:fungal-specific transcription factor domain-domain-containing protein [Microdochium bolleyi]|uniref:Fungal-specific transcription factor domain-domain-containing protein n=1 Tax=Microdochium bolleyi TaxID=196109 RepID=A0A136JDY8_9PEZI|nr:fungal-specific transcription factor domain-domain-containing protein [Microdochium bolleyi]
MLSNPLQRFSPYHSLQTSGSLPNGAHVSPNHFQHNNSLRHGAQYGVANMQQQVGVQIPPLVRASPVKHRHHPYAETTTKTNGRSGVVRRRISRACDQCNQLRTKCDGQHPCAHCVEFGLGCEYMRERKKRGKASRKDLAQQAAASKTASSADDTGGTSPDTRGEAASPSDTALDELTVDQSLRHRSSELEDKLEQLPQDAGSHRHSVSGLQSLAELSSHQPHIPTEQIAMEAGQLESPNNMTMNAYGSVPDAFEGTGLSPGMLARQAPNAYHTGPAQLANYADLPFAMPGQTPPTYSADGHVAFPMDQNQIGGYAMPREPASPSWMPMASSPTTHYQPQLGQSKYSQIRYPVLQPLLPYLNNIVPISLACELIELYFASSSSAHAHPMSPYILGLVFRKRSFLHPRKPRSCQPALLASMLWVAAQTSDAPALTSIPSARTRVCQKLLELTVSLLKPLIHTPSGEGSPIATAANHGVALGGLGVALPGTIGMEGLAGEFGAFGAAGTLDDVATYIHLATVASASEYKGASLRWWNAAWSLARELKLGRELPSYPAVNPNGHLDTDCDAQPDENLGGRATPGSATEEEREERRRIWWLVYIVDRHLALCYNRPLFLLDIECESLRQPMDDTEWQNGSFEEPPIDDLLKSHQERPCGPPMKCTGHSIFGYFLPLMTILGEIVDLHHVRNHPRFGIGFRTAPQWDDQQLEIVRHLEEYAQSLKDFELFNLQSHSEEMNNDATGDLGDTHSPSGRSVHTNTSRMTESDVQTRIVTSYGTHVMHVLHILLTGKWDPINLFDDNDLWISSQEFIDATSHAVSAAEAIGNILEYDPGLEFMPFFYGIYLLQGSFLLLLIADKLQGEASPNVVRACESIVRAHEASVVTLNTEYQRNFSRVMRSALAQVKGRVSEDLGEQHQRRRELLGLYRWTGNGTGLAL